MNELLETLYRSDLSFEDYLTAEAAILDNAAGHEWKVIAKLGGYYTPATAITDAETEKNVEQFTYFD